MTAAKEPANRSHAVVLEFRNDIEDRKQKLLKLLDGKVLSLYAHVVSTRWITPSNFISSTKQEYELKDTLINVILYTQRERTEVEEKEIKQLSISKPTASAIYCRVKADIASSRALLEHYERASQQVALSKKVPMMGSGLQRHTQTLRRILDNQREKTKLQIHQLLNKNPKPSKEQVEEDVSTLDTDLWDQFAVDEAQRKLVEALDGSKGETWAVIARNAQRGVQRAVKDLPEYDE